MPVATLCQCNICSPQPPTNFKIVYEFLSNRKIELSSFINLDNYSAWVAAN